MNDLYERVIRMMVDLHPALWRGASWEIGVDLRDRISEARALSGDIILRDGRLMGWPVKWVEGDGLEVIPGGPRVMAG